MPNILEIDSAIAGEISCSGEGWIAAVLCSPDTDSAFLTELGRYTVMPREGRSLAAWSDAFSTARMSLDLIVSEKGGIQRTTLSEARAMYGPALVGGPMPAAAWVETDGKSWRLCVFEDGNTRVLTESPRPLRHPVLVRDGVTSASKAASLPADGRLWVGYDVHEKGVDTIRVLPADGMSERWVMEGRCPVLASTNGALWVAGERRGAIEPMSP